MSRILIIGLMTEGPTDVRFLKSIITRTFEEILYESDGSVEIYDIQHIETPTGSFIEKASYAASQADENGVTILCIHTDADDRNDNAVFRYKITPALNEINISNSVCKDIVPIVPVQMTESWMLADLSLLKEEIMTEKSNNELQIGRLPELIADPKTTIKNAIHISQEDISKRRKRYELSINDIYLPLGQKIKLSELQKIPSYAKFRNSVETTLRRLNFLR